MIKGPIDFNDTLVENPAAPLANPVVLFAGRIAGDSIKRISIYPNDFAVVNKARQLHNGKILLALLESLFTMQRYCITQDDIRLEAANPNYPDMTITEANDFELWASSPIPFGRG
ncbi:MAG: LexA family protein [Methylocystis sp.]